jgi:5-(carboxyamino)imidazole ribonucleotide synthase
VDVLTYEFENVPVAAVAALENVCPPPRALELSQDRLVEKRLLAELGIPTPRFGESVADTGLPALAKTRRLGYDGKGQRLVRTADEAARAVEELGGDVIFEELVEFRRELSILAVRSTRGETAFYPLVENEHAGGILRVSRAPAAGAPQAEAEGYAARLLDRLGYAGVLALELFETADGGLLANELAPRVHNSGHWTIEGAVTSQFENHLRAILGLPLGPTAALPGGAAMVNLIGDAPPLERLLAVPGAHVHLYGKAPRPGRKLGHVTLVGEAPASLQQLRELAAQ